MRVAPNAGIGAHGTVPLRIGLDDVQKALTAYTTANAYAGFQENRRGLIAPGYLEDLTLLDTDLTTCAPGQISRARVLRTVVDGEVRFGEEV